MNNRPTANATIAAVHDPKPDVVPSSVIIACAVVFAVPPVACPNLSRTVTPTPIIIAKTTIPSASAVKFCINLF